ncbi:MAG: RNA-binding protein [Holosporaceae bacterium]|nr:RNA-binding protein [Holosporaceae bacterium]
MYKLILYCCVLYGLNVESMNTLPDAQAEGTTMLYITNLPYTCDVVWLKEKLDSCRILPRVRSVHMPLNRKGQTIGIAFVGILCSKNFFLQNLQKEIDELELIISKEHNRKPVFQVMNRKNDDGSSTVDSIRYTYCDDELVMSWQVNSSWQVGRQSQPPPPFPHSDSAEQPEQPPLLRQETQSPQALEGRSSPLFDPFGSSNPFDPFAPLFNGSTDIWDKNGDDCY